MTRLENVSSVESIRRNPSSAGSHSRGATTGLGLSKGFTLGLELGFLGLFLLSVKLYPASVRFIG